MKFDYFQCCYQSDDQTRMAGISGLCELLCKSRPDSDAGTPSVTLTQLGVSFVEESA